MNPKQILETLIEKHDLSEREAIFVMQGIMEGVIPPAQVAGILIALRIKKESVDEIVAFASVMRQKATRIIAASEKILDTCGTGGDASGSFNISTTVALLLAGGDYRVAKHGNRSMTSRSGSADVLEALGININLTPQQVGDCIEKVGIGFLFAPALHSAMKNVIGVRKELAVRTVFNILGPLTNPAGANIQVIGLFSADLVLKVTQVLKQLGAKSAYVVAGLSGFDEVCVHEKTKVAKLSADGKIEEFLFDPTEYGFETASLDLIRGGSPNENAGITEKIL
ncbi:MAG: anthranilate phosphoribosyltransferase, partial [Deltaproteobacteria bacterium]|nr:anthranilate phosphoribosyltransferase [Deltaproteobacteria bacterium]